MLKIKRMRIFAGPNGSGKSTLFDLYKEQFNPGVFLNSDVIDQILLNDGSIDLSHYGLTSKNTDLEEFYKKKDAKSLLGKAISEGFPIKLTINENKIFDESTNSQSYGSSLINSFIRSKLFDEGINFCFETVMSHESKLQEISEAKNRGYKTYLYFVCLDDVEVNISRVDNRVNQGGHSVDDGKIKARYTRTLNNLLHAINLADESYLFDNSNEMLLFAEVKNGEINILVDEEFIPNWFFEYVVNRMG